MFVWMCARAHLFVSVYIIYMVVFNFRSDACSGRPKRCSDPSNLKSRDTAEGPVFTKREYVKKSFGIKNKLEK